MASKATISNSCPEGFVYLTPGRLTLNSSPTFATSPPAEEEIVVDAMIANGVAIASYINPSVTITLLQPIGCEFVMVDEHLRQNDIDWQFAGSTRTMRAAVNTGAVDLLNRGNSRSFRFAIKGRANRDIQCKVLVTAQAVDVAVDSCQWTIDGLGPDTLNMGGPFDTLK